MNRHPAKVRPIFLARSVLVAGLFACAPAAPVLPATDVAAPASTSDVYPGAEWARVDRPENVGWYTPGLRHVEETLSGMSTTAFMAIVGGRVLMDYGDVSAVSYLASVRKSVLSMLYGIHIERGEIDIDRTLADLDIDVVGGLTAAVKLAWVRDLLAARSGVYHVASTGGDDLASAPARGSQPHGTYYLYSNWDFNALGTIFEQATGRDIYDAFEADFARPMQFRDFNRAQQRRTNNATASRHPAYHFTLSTRDMARIGYLMLRQGLWRDRQMISQDWVRRMVTPHTRVEAMNPASLRSGPFGYGYLWWIWDGRWHEGAFRGAYTGSGAIGQWITVLPALDMVVAHKTRQGQASVSRAQYLDLVNDVIGAKCG
jgi:CubicO group peptidase (beta-lactamase class C family)